MGEPGRGEEKDLHQQAGGGSQGRRRKGDAAENGYLYPADICVTAGHRLAHTRTRKGAGAKILEFAGKNKNGLIIGGVVAGLAVGGIIVYNYIHQIYPESDCKRFDWIFRSHG